MGKIQAIKKGECNTYLRFSWLSSLHCDLLCYDISVLKIKATGCFEMLVISCQSIRSHKPKIHDLKMRITSWFVLCNRLENCKKILSSPLQTWRELISYGCCSHCLLYQPLDHIYVTDRSLSGRIAVKWASLWNYEFYTKRMFCEPIWH
jgi:hypothetical protein